MNNLAQLKKELYLKSDKEKAKILSNFFKTGKGQYGEGDIFLGIVIPKIRELVKKYWNLISIKECEKLLNSKFHEERLLALLILVKKFEKNENEKTQIFNFYLKNTKKINNWDLVDLSAPNIVGNYLLDKDKSILIRWANSENLWEKRISILATFSFIRKKRFKETLEISKILLKDKHDLIHKAVGWMLREIGKRDLKTEEDFLKKYYKNMPRTMLRYAIEKFLEEKRQKYLKGKI